MFGRVYFLLFDDFLFLGYFEWVSLLPNLPWLYGKGHTLSYDQLIFLLISLV